jgi:hypothetical protein
VGQALHTHGQQENDIAYVNAIAYAMEALIMVSVSTSQTAHLLICRANEAVKRIERWAQTRRPGRPTPRKALHPYARPTGK